MDFGIRKPRIAILSWISCQWRWSNCNEEEQIINPAIESAFNEEMLVYGPYPADGFFGSDSYKDFDGVLAMYHDQGYVTL